MVQDFVPMKSGIYQKYFIKKIKEARMSSIMYGHKYIARVRINRVRLPILLVVSWTGRMNIFLFAFAPANLVSRDGFGSPVPRQAESGA